MAYFDNAATTFPKPASVYEFMDRFYRNNGGSAGRGNYELSLSTKGIIDETRDLIRELLHCPAKNVIFEPTATIALNVIIQGLIKSGVRKIYISPFEHNAVSRTLHAYEESGHIKVMQLTVNKDLEYDYQRIRYQFDSEKPDLLILSHASNVIGLISPAEKLFQIAKEYGAITLLDMAQTAGIVETNVGTESIDFAVFAGHKTLLGPTGISGFVMNPRIELPAILFGGTGFESANQDMPRSLPERFEMGTLNTLGVAGLHAALLWIQNEGVENLYTAESERREKLINLLNNFDFIHTVGNVKGRDYVGIVSCCIDGISSDIAGQLFAQRNIAVRTGLHCAPLAHRFLGTFPDGTIRFSVNHFTSDDDFSVLMRALEDIGNNL